MKYSHEGVPSHQIVERMEDTTTVACRSCPRAISSAAPASIQASSRATAGDLLPWQHRELLEQLD